MKDKVKTFQKHPQDTGSMEVQISKLTERIEQLSGHFKLFPKDHSSKRGMVKMVNQRKKSLAYLQKKDPEKYKEIIDSLGLRK